MDGGVSSAIYLVEDGASKFVVKRALEKLRVRDNWFADVSRNTNEQNYLEYVSRLIPGVVPQVYFSSKDSNYFGMEYLGPNFTTWKQLLFEGGFRMRHAELAGTILGTIHSQTAFNETLLKQFDTTANFHQLRVEPYLLTTGARHPALGAFFDAEAQRIEATRESLVHGDFSPKNILIHGERMVVLDCEVAWYGDPVFDVAFLLNHLLLKSLHHPSSVLAARSTVNAFWDAYVQKQSDAHARQIEERLTPLLLMLLLARVDGKSPVEYLRPAEQNFIRNFVYEHLPSPPESLAGICDFWFAQVPAFKITEVDT